MLVLIDAKAVLAAAAKGRSGAAGFKSILRSIAALSLAGGILIYPLYVPSEDNPGDAPSRGLRFLRGVVRDGILDRRRSRRTRCPACGVLASRHPLCVAKDRRGQGEFCRGREGLGYAHRDGQWISFVDQKFKALHDLHNDDGAKAILHALDNLQDIEVPCGFSLM